MCVYVYINSLLYKYILYYISKIYWADSNICAFIMFKHFFTIVNYMPWVEFLNETF